MNPIIIGLTMGDPAGVGPEVIAKVLSAVGRSEDFTPVVIGDAVVFREIVKKLGLDIKVAAFQQLEELRYEAGCIPVLDVIKMESRGFDFGQVNKECGEVSYRAVEKAVDLALSKHIGAIVTAPISKEAWRLAGHPYNGHTDLLADLTETENYRMMFLSERLKVALVTTHLPLKEACGRITTRLVFDTIKTGCDYLKYLGIYAPKIAVCGLNPHAGENGILGAEDIQIIQPAISKAQNEGIGAEGPFPSDTIFIGAIRGEFDLVVAQYHDQGLIPLKLLYFDTAVNVTAGLPIIRTSVDHGTAFNIAGQGIAKHQNMISAIKYAVEIAKSFFK